MIAVLLCSNRVGSSAKIAVRDARRIRASGLDGDLIRVRLFGEYEALIEFLEDGVRELPVGCLFVIAEHVERGKGRVFIDLLRAA